MLSFYHSPLNGHPELCSTYSSKVEGWLIEATMRTNASVLFADFVDRTMEEYGTGHSALSDRILYSFRSQLCGIPWKFSKKGTVVAGLDWLWRWIPAEHYAKNSTKDWRDPTKEEAKAFKQHVTDAYTRQQMKKPGQITAAERAVPRPGDPYKYFAPGPARNGQFAQARNSHQRLLTPAERQHLPLAPSIGPLQGQVQPNVNAWDFPNYDAMTRRPPNPMIAQNPPPSDPDVPEFIINHAIARLEQYFAGRYPSSEGLSNLSTLPVPSAHPAAGNTPMLDFGDLVPIRRPDDNRWVIEFTNTTAVWNDAANDWEWVSLRNDVVQKLNGDWVLQRADQGAAGFIWRLNLETATFEEVEDYGCLEEEDDGVDEEEEEDEMRK